jgi:hypothetical protein
VLRLRIRPRHLHVQLRRLSPTLTAQRYQGWAAE